MRTVALSGWGQPHDALAGVVPDAVHLDYAHAANVDEVFRMLKMHEPERIIGWSLGGQLAVRAVAAGVVKPKQLFLIAVPYQFKANAKFEQNYARNPARTLEKAWALIHHEDSKSEYIKDTLSGFNKDAVLQKDWLRWLRLLMHYNCDNLELSTFPATTLLQGDKDVVVEPEQSERFANKIPHARKVLWVGCGHAPHFHDTNRTRELIAEVTHVRSQ